ncbi:hypothetical protein GGI21_006452, partial [Coemansia aciculifera]
MSQIEHAEKAQTLVKAKPARKKLPVPAKSYRRSVRLAAKVHPSSGVPQPVPPATTSSRPTTANIAKDFYNRLEEISKQLSLLTVGQATSLISPIAIPIGKAAKDKEPVDNIVASFDS